MIVMPVLIKIPASVAGARTLTAPGAAIGSATAIPKEILPLRGVGSLKTATVKTIATIIPSTPLKIPAAENLVPLLGAGIVFAIAFAAITYVIRGAYEVIKENVTGQKRR